MVPNNLQDPWLVAVWPGMGNVALAAGTWLVEHLGARPLGLLRAEPHFDVDRAVVKGGLIQPARLPQNTLYGWKDPAGQRDLVLFVGEAQPSFQAHGFSRTLLSAAAGLGVQRVLTFAAMVTPIHPSQPSRVFRVATSSGLAAEVDRLCPDLVALEDGEISGLNGTFLAAAAEGGKDAIGLLGEVPEIGTGVPYLKASLAVLEAFQRITGVQLQLDDLRAQAAQVERGLIELLQRVQKLPVAMLPDLLSRLAKASAQERAEAEEEQAEAEEGEAPAGRDEEEAGARPRLGPEAVALIEELFLKAATDRTEALRLKEELDRRGVFQEYENRFLDLFRRRGDPA